MVKILLLKRVGKIALFLAIFVMWWIAFEYEIVGTEFGYGIVFVPMLIPIYIYIKKKKA